EPLLLLRRPGEGEDLGVPGVARLVSEADRAPRAGAEDLVHQPELHLAEALPAQVGRQVRRPESALLDLLLTLADQPAVDLLVVDVDDFERVDLLLHGPAHPGEPPLELGLGPEFPARKFPPASLSR